MPTPVFRPAHGPGPRRRAPQRLDQADKPAYRGFPAIAFDADGSLHAVWNDVWGFITTQFFFQQQSQSSAEGAGHTLTLSRIDLPD